MLERTRRLWTAQVDLVGDRVPLFAAVAEAVGATRVLYPGSYVDLTPSFLWPSVTYVDVDRRAKQFFADQDGVAELVAEHGIDPKTRTVRFVPGDYRDPLPLEEGTYDLLVSLYAGFVSEHCTTYLRPGGSLLVSSSHGDAAMASIDPRYRLSGVVHSMARGYRVATDDLGTYLVPKRAIEVTAELLHERGRGIAYTRSPFAYLFELSA